ncbi:MAG: diaminopimelate epimerase [Bacteroidota bacterium]|nr:diaminopimelate epimerase [Bacteroidota bacterium]
MIYQFYKYEGCGNDFIIFDERTDSLNLTESQIATLCDRRFGVGADGLLSLRKHPEFDFQMVYYNADGSRATMCGNGARCLSAFAHTMGAMNEKGKFIADDGPHTAEIQWIEDTVTQVSISMKNATPQEVSEDHIFINTGTPHYVLFVEDIETADVVTVGRNIRYKPQFSPVGTNVNFVQIKPDGIIVRTYEKGVEDETLACGTGVTASAMAASLRTGKTDFEVKARGGILHVSFDKSENTFTNVVLTGPARQVYTGRFDQQAFKTH